jgi:hypothetical protein
LLVIVGTLSAKVVDPKPIFVGNVTYRSHSNYVEAIVTRTEKVLWKTILFEEGYVGKYDPDLEDDVQWNIIYELRLDSGVLFARNGKGEEFYIDIKTGTVLGK